MAGPQVRLMSQRDGILPHKFGSRRPLPHNNAAPYRNPAWYMLLKGTAKPLPLPAYSGGPPLGTLSHDMLSDRFALCGCQKQSGHQKGLCSSPSRRGEVLDVSNLTLFVFPIPGAQIPFQDLPIIVFWEFIHKIHGLGLFVACYVVFAKRD